MGERHHVWNDLKPPSERSCMVSLERRVSSRGEGRLDDNGRLVPSSRLASATASRPSSASLSRNACETIQKRSGSKISLEQQDHPARMWGAAPAHQDSAMPFLLRSPSHGAGSRRPDHLHSPRDQPSLAGASKDPRSINNTKPDPRRQQGAEAPSTPPLIPLKAAPSAWQQQQQEEFLREMGIFPGEVAPPASPAAVNRTYQGSSPLTRGRTNSATHRAPSALASLPWRRERSDNAPEADLKTPQRRERPQGSARLAADRIAGQTSSSPTKTIRTGRAATVGSRAEASSPQVKPSGASSPKHTAAAVSASARSTRKGSAGARRRHGMSRSASAASQRNGKAHSAPPRRPRSTDAEPGRAMMPPLLRPAISALADPNAGYPVKLQAVHDLNREMLKPSTLFGCEEIGAWAAQKPALKAMLDMVVSGEPHAFMAINALHFASFSRTACGILVSLHTVETLSGLLRAANTLEPELAHSALSLLVTLTSTDQGCRQGCGSKVLVSISSRFLGQEDRSTRRLAHRLVEAQLSHGKGLKAACDNSRLLQRLEEHLAQEADDEEIARIRETMEYIKLTKRMTRKVAS